MTPIAPRPEHQQQVALVTGGNRGIGLAAVTALSPLVGHVVLGSRNLAEGQAALAALGPSWSNITCQRLDVDDSGSISESRDAILNAFGHLDILINNAGIYCDIGSIIDTPTSVIEANVRTHALGPFELIKAFAPAMRRCGYGRIVNISSGLGALNGMQGGSVGYRLSKAALNALTLVAAHELQGSGILVNAMCPGGVGTRLTNFRGTKPEEATDTIVYLAMLPPDGPTGRFFRYGSAICW